MPHISFFSRLFRAAPLFIGGAGGADDPDLCASLTSIEAQHWEKNGLDCVLYIERASSAWLAGIAASFFTAVIMAIAIWSVSTADATREAVREAAREAVREAVREAAAAEARREAAREAAAADAQVAAEARETAREAAREAAAATRFEAMLKATEMHLRVLGAAPSPSPITPAHRAHAALCFLARIKDGISDAAPGVGDAILSAAEQAALVRTAAAESERGVVKFLTPYLARLRGCAGASAAPSIVPAALAPVLVNSEELPWLVHAPARARSDMRLKPDLFRSWAPFVDLRDGGAGQGEGAGYIFGALGSYSLQCVGAVSEVYEAKRGALSDSDFGELCAYHECIAGGCRGVLLGPREFWLYETFNGTPVRLVRRARWTAAGSVALFCSFFAAAAAAGEDEPPLLALLRALLVATGTEPCHLREGERRRCFLGAGASGHVFAVRSALGGAAAPPRALKAVLESAPMIRGGVVAEFTRMFEAARAGAPVVQPVLGSLIVLAEDAGAARGSGGFLLEQIGEPAVVTSRRRCGDAFSALAALHAACVYHGDARLPNLLLVAQPPPAAARLLWIDLLGGVAAPELRALPVYRELLRADAEMLARSILRAAEPALLPPPVRAALDENAPSGRDALAYAAIAESVATAAGL